MDKGYEKERFESLSIKTSIAQKFKKFSKQMGASQSMTLLLMLDFFEANGISPIESLGPHIHTLESLIKKRINAVMAVIKDIEKNQTKPTAAMMHALFEGEDPSENKPLLTERKQTAKTLESELQNWMKKKEAQKHQEPKK
ncbi:BfmA/BtgA family mobilization protein [Muricauda sp. 334s03]|uniref:BfmA/BtgA family mobilization protein n=1 Tax=Flagellimonas yonaguniensis TaxID=3031325 RepID=A0ABT5XY21_9FLAO|nr:BfmA/BtgA family mobilization protein [[Muricauda] yonaguniensis]MDF0716088.1 BfmA/BtgA family mobilization protein [[Muricauda] yonaguniensis]